MLRMALMDFTALRVFTGPDAVTVEGQDSRRVTS